MKGFTLGSEKFWFIVYAIFLTLTISGLKYIGIL